MKAEVISKILSKRALAVCPSHCAFCAIFEITSQFFEQECFMIGKCFFTVLLLVLVCHGDIALEGTFDWDAAGKDYRSCIKLAKMELKQPRIMKINAARIEIKNPKVDFCTARPDERAGQVMEDAPKLKICTRRQSVVDFMKEVRKPVEDGGRGLNMVLGVNTTGWGPWPAPFGNKYAGNLGLVVADGKLVSPPLKRRTAFIIDRDRSCRILNPDENFDISNVYYAVSGFASVLKDGVCSGDKALHPRTGFGVSQDGEYMIIVVIDGRQKGYSEGCTTKEVAQLLKYFGAWNGMNMDGGGSSSLVALDEKNRPVMLNHHFGGAVRKIACPFGFIVKE